MDCAAVMILEKDLFSWKLCRRFKWPDLCWEMYGNDILIFSFLIGG